MITAGLTTSFKREVLLGVHDFSADVFKIALYTSSANLGPNTTVYSTTNEISGTGYVVGGNVLSGITVQQGDGVGYVSFNDPTWLGTSFTTRGALIYNFTKSGKAVGVLNFGTDQTTVSQGFTIQLPTNNPETAVIRVT
jgi:translation elongation factor EF-Tu-like GTPase